MPIQWSPSLAKQLVPWIGEPFQLAAKPRKDVPATPTHDEEVARGVAAGLHQRYDAAGKHARDPAPRELVDAWCARAGLDFATGVLCAIGRTPHGDPTRPKSYMIRHDGQPWRRLREQLAAADPGARERAQEVARRARDEVASDPRSTPRGIAELRAGLAYAFCDDAWVAEALPQALSDGYGQLAVLAAVRDPELLARSIEALFAQPIYHLVEELVPHAPAVVATLGEERAELIVRIARRAATKPLRKPWLAILACLEAEEARQYLAEVA